MTYPETGDTGTNPDLYSGEGQEQSKKPGFLSRLSAFWKRAAHPVLFILTLATTFMFGLITCAGFQSLAENNPGLETAGFGAWLSNGNLVFSAIIYTIALLGFLTAHEMGHYLMCRRYGIRATLPYYLPNPLIFGTFGAVIRIKSPIRNKKQLFDIGIAGPLAGFVVAVPLFYFGLQQSLLVPLETLGSMPGGEESFIVLGEPVLHKLFVTILFQVEGNYTLVMSPLGMVGWFACLVTAINLLPVSQLDGGHILYAVFGKAHFYISLLVVGSIAILALVTQYWGWLFWILLIVLFKLRHPPLIDESTHIGIQRRLLALVALLVFILSFMPAPIDVSL